jgi:hypothetical protein
VQADRGGDKAVQQSVQRCGSQFARVNDRHCLWRAELVGDDRSVGKPIEFGRHMTTSVIIGDNGPAVSGHALADPITDNLVGQGGMKLEAPSCQRVERSAGTPVKRQKAAGLAGLPRRPLPSALRR